MRNNTNSRNGEATLRFILKQIKMLVIDDYGDLSFIENADNVIYDLYDYKNLIHKLYHCESNRQHVAIFSDFGMEDLFNLVNDPRVYSALQELIAIDIRSKELDRIFKKANKKGKKKDKTLLKEYEYSIELYKDSIKRLRKELDIKPRKKYYKKKYSTLNSLTKNNRDRTGFWFDDEDDDFYEDAYSMSRTINRNYDEDDDSGLYDKFMKNTYGDRGSSGKKIKSSRQYVDPFEDEDDDEYDDEDGVTGIDILSAQLQKLIDLQDNKKSSSEVLPKTYNDYVDGNDVKDSIKTLEQGMVELSGSVTQIMEFLRDVVMEDADDEDECTSSVVQNFEPHPQINRNNRDYGTPKREYETLTREELVDIVNTNEEEKLEPLRPQVITYPREGVQRAPEIIHPPKIEPEDVYIPNAQSTTNVGPGDK